MPQIIQCVHISTQRQVPNPSTIQETLKYRLVKIWVSNFLTVMIDIYEEYKAKLKNL